MTSSGIGGIAVQVGADAIGTAHGAESRYEDPAVGELFSVHVEDTDIGVAADRGLQAGVDDVEPLFVGRKSDSVRPADAGGRHRHPAGLWVQAINLCGQFG